ncbi:ribosomal protein L1-like protein [Lipomyces kononenkoae]|uniref:Ribosomal protein L1-like protein n=1 Tax=Lipomyces kononenkoae TaxID=34357 RepID=A0ACC3T968_LIPKO
MIIRPQLSRAVPRFTISLTHASPTQYRPQLATIQLAQPRFKGDKKKKKDAPSSAASRQSDIQAQQARAKQQERDERRRDLKRRTERERAEARHTKVTPVLMDIETASKYLKAAEVGRPEKTSTITITLKLALPLHFQSLRGTVRLPKLPQAERVAVFSESPEIAEAALKAGAAFAGGDELVNKVKNGEITFEKSFATPGALPLLRGVQRILGPKGLMPSERRGTVAEDVVGLLETSHGVLDFRTRGKSLTAVIARTSFTPTEIATNVAAFMAGFRKAIKNSTSRQAPLVSEIILSSTFGPGVMILA